VVHVHVVADLGRFADHDAHAVVDENSATEVSGGMDLDAGQEAGDLREQARGEAEIALPEPVCDAVEPDGVEPGVQQDFGGGPGGGVCLASCANVFGDSVDHWWGPMWWGPVGGG
jgi:hypothetical protein